MILVGLEFYLLVRRWSGYFLGLVWGGLGLRRCLRVCFVGGCYLGIVVGGLGSDWKFRLNFVNEIVLEEEIL